MKLEDLLFEEEYIHIDAKGKEWVAATEEISLFEIFTAMPNIVKRERRGQDTFIYYIVQGNNYVVLIDEAYHSPSKIRFANFVFGFVNENGDIEYKLQNWKSSPVRVLGAALQILVEEVEKLNVDAITIGASNKYGDVDKRMRVYKKMARWLARMPKFGVHQEVLKTSTGKMSIVWTPNLTAEQHNAFEEYLVGRGK